MKPDSIREAVAQAYRFIDAAELVLNNLRKVKADSGAIYEYVEKPKESGALRRASMDLTRSLADMRKPG